MFFKSIHKFANGFLKADSLKKRLRHHKSRLVLEQLEDRLCLALGPYTYYLVAATGSTVNAPGSGGASVGTLTNMSLASINDSGNVAFLGTINGFNGVDEATFPSDSVALTDLSFTNRNFTFPQIDNNGDVIAQDQFLVSPNLNTYIRLWQPSGLYTVKAQGSSANGDILVVPTISPDGTQFAYQDNLSGTLILYINGTPAHTFPAGSGGLRPKIANNGAVVVQDGSTTTSPIKVFELNTTPVTIADSTNFSALGNSPAISPDGSIVAFYGDLTATGAQNLNQSYQNLGIALEPLNPGPGIFASIDVGGSWVIFRLAGVSGNGFLDPGETEMGGTDVGPFSGFIPNAGIGVSISPDGATGQVAYMATDTSGNQGVYSSTIDLVDLQTGTVDNPIGIGDPVNVVSVGDSIIGSAGPITGLSLYDPINTDGQIAFVMNTASGQDVVRANPGPYTPAQIRAAYGLDQLPSFTDQNGNAVFPDGKGQTIAIINTNNDPNIFSDLDTFDMTFGINSSGPTLYQQYGAASSFLTVSNELGQASPLPIADSSNREAAEEALDVEWAHSLAPGAYIDVIECNNDIGDVMTGVMNANSAKNAAGLTGVSVVSMSLGANEATNAQRQFVTITAMQEKNYDSIFALPALQGVTFLAASGDYGTLDASYPAFSPSVVAVGGTTLYLNPDDTYSQETAWEGSGSGISSVEPEPAFQKAVVPASITTTNRAIPDVAFDADPATGMQAYNSYVAPGNTPPPSFWFTADGTSLSTPCWAGLMAIVDQGRALEGSASLGNQSLPALYSLPAGDFHDITAGSNGTYSAGPGYDLLTGRGSPIANLLIPGLVAYTNAPTITVSTSSLNLGTTTQGTAGDSQSFTVSGSNLTADIILTAPTGVELSDDGGTSYSSTLDLVESGGTVGTTTVFARITVAAPLGPVTGTIAADSTGATEQGITVSGTVTAPTITVSTNLLDLGTTTQGTPGDSQSFTVSGSNLTADIILTAPTGVELSDNGGSYSSTLDLVESGGTVGSTAVLARISATAPVGPVSGVIAADSTGATEKDISVSGTVNPVPTPAITVSTSSLNLGTTTQGTAGTSQSFTVSGTNLTADIILTAPTGVELSDNGSYSSPRDLVESGGTVGVTTVLARISATAPVGPLSGVIAADSTGATEKDISVSGTVINPFTITAISPVSPNPRNTPVSTIDVTFSRQINLNTLIAGLTLSDNGGSNLINGAVTASLVSGSTYQISGLSGLTSAEGNYVLTVSAAVIQDQNGNLGSGTLSTSWLMDLTAPTSHVNALPKREMSLSFAVSVTGTDPNGAGGSPPSGVALYDIYASTNGGPWSLWTTVPASNSTATFTGQSNTTYAFYSIAHDLAGNTEVKKPVIEASTYLPDLTPPVTFVDSTTGTNPSSVNTSTGTFTLNVTGSDPGGSVLTYFEVFVSVDSGSYTMVNGTAIPAGPADSSGNVHASIPYQGLTDGAQHSYAFYSIGLDGAGNVQSAPSTPNLNLIETFAQPSALQVTSLVVENGAVERSFVRYLDVDFNESDSQSGGALTQIVNSVASSAPDIVLYKYDLNGDASSKTAVSLSGVSVAVIDHAIELDFGAKGIGGNPNTTAADGYYEVDIKLPNGSTAVHHFDRLLGDVTGDGVVDNNDLNAIAADINLSSQSGITPLNADVTGVGTVTAFDLTLATRSKGRKLGSGLSLG